MRPSSRLTLALLTAILAGTALAQTPTPDGAAVFQRSCATCHNGAADSRAPRVETLRDNSPEAIIDAARRKPNSICDPVRRGTGGDAS
jgi:mono/diheme cytochrome c family protein